MSRIHRCITTYFSCVLAVVAVFFQVITPYGITFTVSFGAFMGAVLFVILTSIPWVNKCIGWNSVVKQLAVKATGE